MSKKVSAIIAVWDRPQILHRSVSSVLTQTHKNLELIVVGDGCPPEVEREYLEVVASFKDDRIRWMNCPEHGADGKWVAGAANRNYALEHATGEYIAPLDDDDMWVPWHLEECVSILENQPDVGLVHGQWVCLYTSLNIAKIHGKGPVSRVKTRQRRSIEGRTVGHLTVVYRAEHKHIEYVTRVIDHKPADLLMWRGMHEKGVKFHFDARVHGIKYSRRRM